ncbi:hypothetical protein [Ktedonospora formicarum]|uniref:Transmembrane protein n=1 Tax=Ktedonospora formicarum TaxID=2778364 RepID=A0A8J3MRF6_9CHLR|nr:hypothetical protein [Ktedonospora formicarum]GHO44995.1 hypothetical protein KSX_31580 [Ktedonospora formicarum]
MLGRSDSRGYLTAAIGALVAVLAFVIFPYGSIDYTLGNNDIKHSLAIKASDFTTAGSWFTLPLGIIWLSVLLLLAAIIVALVAFARSPKSEQPGTGNMRWIGEALTTLGALSLILFLWTYFLVILRIKDVYPAQMQASVALSLGSILFIVFALITTAGGIMAMTAKRVARKRATGQLLANGQSR